MEVPQNNKNKTTLAYSPITAKHIHKGWSILPWRHFVYRYISALFTIVNTHTDTHTYTYKHTYINYLYVYIYMYIYKYFLISSVENKENTEYEILNNK